MDGLKISSRAGSTCVGSVPLSKAKPTRSTLQLVSTRGELCPDTATIRPRHDAKCHNSHSNQHSNPLCCGTVRLGGQNHPQTRRKNATHATLAHSGRFFAYFGARGKKYLTVRGISIVNGAQTTGAIGSLKKAPDDNARVPARFVQTSNAELIYNIIQFNNSQNKVTASDFRSTDRFQKRLRTEVEAIPNAKYEGGRRGGHKDVIERNKNLLPWYTVGQALAACHQDPLTAYNQKSEIWISDKIYSRYFNDETSGAHLVFCYSLLRAVEEAKRSLLAKSKSNGTSLTTQESDLLSYFRHRGSTYLIASAIASCMETLVGRRIPNLFRISFGQRMSPKQATQLWTEVVCVVSPFSTQLVEALSDGLKSNERAQKSIATFRSLYRQRRAPTRTPISVSPRTSLLPNDF